MTVDDLFASSDAVMDEAYEALDRFNEALSRLRRETRVLATIEPIKGSDWFQYVFELPTPPRRVRGKAYVVVSSARHALDQAVYAATQRFGHKPKKKTNFPFGETSTDFAHVFEPRARGEDIAKELIPLLTSMRPWWTRPNIEQGNDILRFLGQIANENKHQVVLNPAPSLDRHQMLGGSYIRGGAAMIWPPERIDNSNKFVFIRARQPELNRTGHVIDYTIELGHSHDALPKNAVVALSTLMEMARSCIGEIKAACR